MKDRYLPAAVRCVTLLLTGSLLLTACDSNDSGGGTIDITDPESLVGTYRLDSLLDKNGDVVGVPGASLEAGEITSITITEDGQTFEAMVIVEGTLTLDSATYSFDFMLEITVFGQTNTEEDFESGTWSVSNGRITLTGNDPDSGGPEVLDIAADGNRLIVENQEFRFVFEKQ